MSANYDFKGRTILVTGAGAGIGKCICENLVSSNAKVIAVSLLQDELEALQAELPGIQTVAVDLADWNATQLALQGLGPVHGLVNNAGVTHPALFLQISEQQFNKTFDVNAKAVLNVSQIIAQTMIENNLQGSIVNISSIAALKAMPSRLTYSSSKAAVVAMTKCMALELGPHRIRVNSVHPTFVLTNMTRSRIDSPDVTDIIERTPLKRLGEKKDIARAVLFLLSDESSMVNGIPLIVDGGVTV